MVLQRVGEAFVLAAGMAWHVAWSLVLGFVISGTVQALVSEQRMRRALGGDGIREIALAVVFGSASSSCSYAAAAIMKTLFAKGAGLIASLAFLFASTNLVVELGIILWLLLGWQFTVAEWLGGIVLVAVMSLLVRLTYPKALVEEARRRLQAQSVVDPAAEPTTIARTIARNVVSDVSMLWKDIVGGFLIAGALAAFVPSGAWRSLFLVGGPPGVRLVENALVGPLIAVLSFVCSIGNVPLAAILWSSGISFGGVLAFLYADLIVLPLLDVYRKYYGLRMTLYLFAIFFSTMALSAIVMDAAFSALHLVPRPNPEIRTTLERFSIDGTFWLNVVFAGVAAAVWRLAAMRDNAEPRRSS
jgi:uncharacterized membrane protein YraQ (UPF0718 family)